MVKQKLYKILVSLSLSAIVLLFITTMSHWRFFHNFNLWGQNLLSRLNSSDISEQIVIVVVDRLKLENINLQRNNYASLLEKLLESNPRVIGFDIPLSTNKQGIDRDTLERLLLNNNNEDLSKALLVYTDNIHPKDKRLNHITKSTSNLVMAGVNIKDSNKFQSPGGVQGIIASVFTNDYINVGIHSIQKGVDDLIRDSNVLFYENNPEELEDFAVKVVRTYLDGYNTKNSGDIKDGKYILKTDNKTIQIPLTEENRMLINYSGKPRSYRGADISEVINGTVSDNVFRDKIVLVGIVDNLENSNFTPMSSNTQMTSVEIHANAIQTILDEKFLVYQSKWSETLVWGILLLVAVIVFMYFSVWLGMIGLALFTGGYFLYANLAYRNGLVVSIFYPMVGFGICYIASIIYRYFSEMKKGQELRGAFAHYVSSDVVEQIMQNPGMLKLGGQKRNITVFFSDIENFTTISESLEPEELVQIMNEYLDVMSRILMKYGGTVDKYEGDAIMAFFNAPLDQPEHSLQAAEAVIECRRILKSLHQKWQKEGKPLMNFRVGLATGDAVVGNMGSQERFDYTAMGDVVNTASRLEGANKTYGTRILLNPQSALEVQHRFVLRDIDLVRVKGKNQPVQVFELLARKGELLADGIEMLNCFHQGIALYRKKDFIKALEWFKKAATIIPSDPPTLLYIKRCRTFIDSPPPLNWDGVYTMKTK